jgi:hypothetical protein
MAKGQRRGNREAKKLKAPVKKPIAGTVTAKYEFPSKPAPSKGNTK